MCLLKVLQYFQTSSPVAPKPVTPSSGQSTSNVDGEIYIADGDYIKDIEVNDLRNRYTLTKGSTQKMVPMTPHCQCCCSSRIVARVSGQPQILRQLNKLPITMHHSKIASADMIPVPLDQRRDWRWYLFHFCNYLDAY
jgi:hypothetical protein